MSDETFEAQLDEQLDHTAEGLTPPDELDLAQSREDQQAGESQQEKTVAAETDEDLSGEKFAYELPDGTKFEGTITEIAEKLAETTRQSQDTPDLQAKIAELEAKLEQVQTKPQEEKAKDDSGIPAVDWAKSGEILAKGLGIDPSEMSNEEAKTLNQIGFALQDGIVREVMTNPYIAGQFKTYAQGVLQEMMEERDTTTKRTSAFEEFVGEKFQEADVVAFQKANPWATNRELAVLGLKAQVQAKGAQSKTKDTQKAVKEAESKARKETIKDLKAKGTLRRLAGQATGTQDKPGKSSPPKTESERLSRWTQRVQEIQQGADR